MKATKPTKVKTVWQVRWPRFGWKQSFKTRQEARDLALDWRRQEARDYAKDEWLNRMRGRPIIVKITEQVVA